MPAIRKTSLTLFTGAFAAILLTSCRDRATPDMAGLATLENSVTSPSGKYVLKVRRVVYKNSPAFAHDVYTAKDDQLVYRCEDQYLERFTTYFAWDDESDRVWVYSGDLGTFIYQVDDKGGWQKRDRSEADKPPSVFKRLRPKQFR